MKQLAENQLGKTNMLGWGPHMRRRLIWPVRTKSRAIFRRLQAGARRQIKKLRTGAIRKIKGLVRRPSKIVGDFGLKGRRLRESPFAGALSLSQEVTLEERMRWARKRLPTAPDYAFNVISMNMAAKANRWGDWNAAFESYLAGWDTPPIQLEATEQVFDFSKLRAPTVTNSKKDGDLVSVLMPVYNGQESVIFAAQSILNQTWRNLELIIIDDASTDETWKRLLQLAATDKRVRIFRNKINAGAYVSRNVGWLQSRGTWITVHDSDDWAHPLRLERTVSAAKNSGSAVGAFQIRLSTDGVVQFPISQSSWSPDGVAQKALSSLVIHRDLMTRLGAWDSVRFGGDSELNSRLEKQLGQSTNWIPFLSMLCSLTKENLSQKWKTPAKNTHLSPRQTYVRAFRSWHQTEEARRPISVAPVGRCFQIPKQFAVTNSSIVRNIPIDLDDSILEPLTLICVSRRPENLEAVIENVARQNYPSLSLIYVSHGKKTDADRLSRLNHLASLETLEIDSEAFLAHGLNKALELASTDLVAKIDDDDIYLENYVRNLVIAEHTLESKPVLLGKAKYFAYLEGKNMMFLRGRIANGKVKYVSGASMMWRRSLTAGIQFPSVRAGTDTLFQRELARRGDIYSSDPYDLIVIRRANKGSHTWKIADEEFLGDSAPVSVELDFSIARSAEPPHALMGSNTINES